MKRTFPLVLLLGCTTVEDRRPLELDVYPVEQDEPTKPGQHLVRRDGCVRARRRCARRRLLVG